jgi:hypothetical protein
MKKKAQAREVLGLSFLRDDAAVSVNIGMLTD